MRHNATLPETPTQQHNNAMRTYMKSYTQEAQPDGFYFVAYCHSDLLVEDLQFTMKQQVDGTTEMEAISIVAKGFPTEDQFPGGCNWIDEEGNKVDNPFYAWALKYFKDHDIAGRRRAGAREFTVLLKPDAEKRGPIVPSAATLRKQWIARRVKDKGISPEAAAEQYDSFNS